ncbi:MAG TPA: malto-oligosyltrehalose synthase [Alphaproteobacteria bacterium]
MGTPPRIPLASYRLQFNREFTFDHAAALVPYLAALGVTHVYASSYLKARPGSSHGYDIIDHNALNPEIGSPESFSRFCRVLHAHGMGQILDFIPNHMGVGKTDNAWWLDVLEWGESSPYADYFDIDWSALRRSFPGKVLLPVLGDQYGVVLERGELQLRFDVEYGGFSIWYFENRFPVRPRDYASIIRRRLSDARLAPAGPAGETLERFAGEFAAFSATPRSRIRRGEARDRVQRLKSDLSRVALEQPDVRRLLVEAADLYNGEPGRPDTFVRLHNLIERQFYRVCYWRAAADEINYRRFFEINDLAGIRPENPRLFAEMHRLIGRLIADGCIHGLRLDHIDGLFDPAAYCAALQRLAQQVAPQPISPDDRSDAMSSRSGLFYIIVEKILARHERLRDSWPVQGTTGYEFLNLVNGVLVDPEGERPMTEAYFRFVKRRFDFDEILYTAKKLIIDTALASELAVLANQLDRLAEQDWRTRDFTRFRLRDALKEIVACFPVYRTYVTEQGVTAEDARDIDWAISQAKKRWLAPDPEIFDFIRQALVAEHQGPLGLPRRAELLRFAMKFQQYTGPVTAKSLEDTAFYRYHRLISLNEVGGDPRQFGISVAAFHRANEERARNWPHSMLATATHDTKRGEDARARIDVLPEKHATWAERVERWSVLNRFRRSEIDGRRAPSRNDEYLFYQALIGAWPAEWLSRKPEPGPALETFQDRLRQYTVKALREAKTRSSWSRPNEPYEAACTRFMTDLVDTGRPNPFLDDFLPFAAQVAFFGMLNSLVQTTLKLTCPGIPDLYRGSELWDFSLVDPDNRRPVDFDGRASLLAELETVRDWRPLLENWADGRIKLALIRRLLAIRQSQPQIFTYGTYIPIEVQGQAAAHTIAFARSHGDRMAVIVVGRLFARLWGEADMVFDGGHRWAATEIAIDDVGGQCRHDAITGRAIDARNGRIAVSEVFAQLPVAVLV